MRKPPAAIRLAGTTLERYYHACAFFHTRDEEYAVVSPFIQEGLAGGEKALHITDPKRRADHLRRLTAAEIDVAAAERRGQLQVLTWDDAYLRDGQFDPDAMLAMLEDALHTSKAEGYGRTRIIGHMEWALEDRPGVNRLLEYEARVNDVLAQHQGPAVCVYDLKQFGAETMVDVLRTHPIVLIGGTLHENPFFVPPDEFLRELAARRAQQFPA